MSKKKQPADRMTYNVPVKVHLPTNDLTWHAALAFLNKHHTGSEQLPTNGTKVPAALVQATHSLAASRIVSLQVTVTSEGAVLPNLNPVHNGKALRLFLCRLKKQHYCAVFAHHPREAAKMFCNRLAESGGMPCGTDITVYVCEHINDGKPGFKIAANTDGDIRYEVSWHGDDQEPEVGLSEKSYAGED